MKSNPPTLLIIDDDLTNLMLLSNILREYKIITESGGKQGLETAFQKRPHLILLDIIMPEMDGFEVCRRLKENRATADIPVIFISTMTKTDGKVKGFEIGAADYITRPYNREEVLARIRTHLTIRLQQIEIQKSEERFRQMAETIEEIFWMFDTRSKEFLYINPAFEILWEHPVADLYSNPKLWLESIHPEDLPAVKAKQKRQFRGEANQQEFRILTESGSTKWISNRSYPVKDENGRLIRITGVSTDITEQKQSAIERIESEQRLLRSEWELAIRNRIAHIFLTSSDCDLYAEILDVVLEAMKSRFGVFGYVDDAEENMIAASLTQDIWWEDCQMEGKEFRFPRESWKGVWGEALKQKKSIISNSRGIVPEGHLAIQNAMSVPILYREKRVGTLTVANKKGDYDEADQELLESIAGYIAPIISDRIQREQEEIQRKQLEEQMVQAQKREAVGTLAGGIAHDFNNILFPVIGYTEMMIHGFQLEPKALKNLEQILKAALRAKDLVAQILAFSRNYEKDLRPMQIAPIVKEALKLLRSTIPTNIAIQNNIKETGPIIADMIQIHQIVINLCTNAYHAMQENSGVLAVNLRETEIGSEEAEILHPEAVAGRYALLSVKDSGFGIAPEIIHQIFEPYFTTKGPDKGSGLGLAVVDGIVRDYHGFITVESEPGVGSKFLVYFPLIETKVIPLQPALNTPEPCGDEHILLVDDEKHIVDMLLQMLQGLGYRVSARYSSLDALEFFRARGKEIDLVITDMAMPQMTGDRLAQKIKAIREEIPIIICTGYSEQMDEQRAKRIGIDGFLLKPISRSDLARSIRDILDGRKRASAMPDDFG